MSLRINTNVPAMAARQHLAATRDALDHTQNKLSSGSRILSAADDASGLAISESLRAMIRSSEASIRGAEDGVYMLRTADGSLDYITNMVIRMKELATSAASDTNGDKERSYLNAEVQALKSELDRISRATIFNGRPLLTGNGGEVAIQVGPRNDDSTDRIYINADLEINTDALGIAGVDISETPGARDSLDTLQNALEVIARARGSIGASEQALTSTISHLNQLLGPLAGANSHIRDADLAFETSEFAKYQILQQSGVAVLSQANQSPAIALKLLAG